MSENKPPSKFGENLTPDSARKQADRNDPFAKEYLEWVALQRRKSELMEKLKTTAGVPDKYRDPEYVEAKKDYSGSPGDLARRALEATAVPGNVLKASLKTPDDPDLSKVDQIANAIKAFTGDPEKAFREQRVMGEDVLANANMSEQDKKRLGIALDIGADFVGTAGVMGGAKLAEKAVGKAAAKAAYGANAVASKAGTLANKVLPKAKPGASPFSLDMPAADTAEDVLARKDLYGSNKEVLRMNPTTDVPVTNPGTATEIALDQEILPKAANSLDNFDMPEISVPAAPPIPAPVAKAPTAAVPAKPVVEDATKRFSMKELQKLEKEEASKQSEALFKRLSGASEDVPTVDSRASEILEQRMFGPASSDIGLPLPKPGAKYYGPEAPASTRILTPNEPVTANKLLKGLEEFGGESAQTLRSQRELDRELETILKATTKKKK